MFDRIDNGVLERVYNKYHMSVLEKSRMLSASTKIDAGDLAIQTLYDFASTYSSFDDSDDYMPILTVINRNRFLTELRRTNNNSIRESFYGKTFLSGNKPSSEDIFIDNETDRQLRSIIGEGKMYDVFKGYSEGASLRDLSEENDLNISQVKILVDKSILQIRENVGFVNGLMNNL